MVPAWVMIICWAYFELLVIACLNWYTAVSAIEVSFQWLDVFTFLCNKHNFIVFFSHEKKISQTLESLVRKWNTLDQNRLATVATWLKQRKSITLNSNFVWWSPAIRVIQVSVYSLIFRLTLFCFQTGDIIAIHLNNRANKQWLFRDSLDSREVFSNFRVVSINHRSPGLHMNLCRWSLMNIPHVNL